MMHFVIYLALGNIVYELQNHKINATQLSKFLHTQGIVPLFFDHVLGLRSPPHHIVQGLATKQYMLIFTGPGIRVPLSGTYTSKIEYDVGQARCES